MNTITTSQVEAALALRDLTDPAQGPHAMQHLVGAIEDALGEAWKIPVRRSPGARIVAVQDNYDALRYDSDAVTRDSRYSRYIDAVTMLRSHTTAAIPGLLRRSTSDLCWSVPGVCYRRDSIDSQHTGEPHQLDLWRLSWNQPLGVADLEAMAGMVIGAVLPGMRWWTKPSVHPYTAAGREIYVSDGLREVEVGECGLAHPDILANAGLPARVTGLAMGLGLDRLLLLAKGIPDIRVLRSSDTRVAGQMNDLKPYRAVSAMPAARRDISIAVSEMLDAELAGDKVRYLLGDEADCIEDLTILSLAPYDQLPEAAVRRMGIAAGQHNALVRLTIRHPTKTLTAADANRIRDIIYAGLHEGTRLEWATPTATR